MTVLQKDKSLIMTIFNKARNTSAFDNVARVGLATVFAIETGEVYGAGMPRFNNALKQLLAEGAIVKSIEKSNRVYYSN
jgi:hypothetical protein